jgi:predicted metal-dependent peptidase
VEARLKGVQKYSPKAVVIVDTSGSMTARCLAKALVVIKQGLQALGQVPVVTCDAKVHQDQTLTSVQQEFELVGGGGTNMVVPIEYTQKKYKPDVTVLVTDTGTPWPDRPIKGQLIVAATQDGFVPPWATKVRIPDSPDKNTLEDE